MKHFFRMRNIRSFFASIDSTASPVGYQKLLLYMLLFSLIFGFRFWAEKQLNGPKYLKMTSPALASASQAIGVVRKKSVLHLKSIDVNSASLKVLSTLPGIGPKLGEAIIQSRKVLGPFLNADALLRVKGIGVKRLEKIRPFSTL